LAKFYAADLQAAISVAMPARGVALRELLLAGTNKRFAVVRIIQARRVRSRPDSPSRVQWLGGEVVGKKNVCRA